MIIDLTGLTALITGSTAGIGFAVAEELHSSGANVVLNGRSEKRVCQAVDQINSKRVQGVVADVGTREGCERLVSEFPDVDILVNNAGIFSPQPVLDISDTDWEEYFSVNVMSGIRLSRYYVRKMMDRGWGRTLFVSSESAVQVPPEMVHYGVTKTSQLAFARGLAEYAKGSGVTVNTVLPGPTLSEGIERFIEQLVDDSKQGLEEAGRQFVEQERPTSLLGRLASPKEVANLVVYLSSEYSSATTGAALRVDGGVLRGIL